MMNRGQLQAEITTQEDAIAGVRPRLKSGKFSRARRDELVREVLKRVQFN